MFIGFKSQINLDCFLLNHIYVTEPTNVGVCVFESLLWRTFSFFSMSNKSCYYGKYPQNHNDSASDSDNDDSDTARWVRACNGKQKKRY